MAHSKSRNLFFCLGAVLALVALCVNLPDLLFWSLCWGQDHDLPPNTTVIVSACQRPLAVGVPDGETLFVYEKRTNDVYLLDLRAGEKRSVPDDPLLLDRGVFLNSELAWLEGSLVGPDNPNYRPHYILDLTTGQRYELLDLDWLPRLEGGKFDPKNFAYIRSAEQVFLHHTENTLIALSADFRDNPNGRVILSQHSFVSYNEGYEHGEFLAKLMDDLGMEYEIVDFSLRYADLPSPSGKYVVRNNGLYLPRTNIPVVTPEYTGARFLGVYFRGWYYDENAIAVQGFGSFLISNSLIGSHYSIPQPVLKVRLP